MNLIPNPSFTFFLTTFPKHVLYTLYVFSNSLSSSLFRVSRKIRKRGNIHRNFRQKRTETKRPQFCSRSTPVRSKKASKMAVFQHLENNLLNPVLLLKIRRFSSCGL